jgi:hypothetical protein
MHQTSKPDLELVRNWMQQRHVAVTPPPSPEQVRTELGWKLVEAERENTSRSSTR